MSTELSTKELTPHPGARCFSCGATPLSIDMDAPYQVECECGIMCPRLETWNTIERRYNNRIKSEATGESDSERTIKREEPQEQKPRYVINIKGRQSGKKAAAYRATCERIVSLEGACHGIACKECPFSVANSGARCGKTQPFDNHILNAASQWLAEHPVEEPLNPCEKCGKSRTKAQGGEIFTICDDCWDTKEEPAEREEYCICVCCGGARRRYFNSEDGDGAVCLRCQGKGHITEEEPQEQKPRETCRIYGEYPPTFSEAITGQCFECAEPQAEREELSHKDRIIQVSGFAVGDGYHLVGVTSTGRVVMSTGDRQWCDVSPVNRVEQLEKEN